MNDFARVIIELIITFLLVKISLTWSEWKESCIGFFKSMRDIFLVFDNALVFLIPRNHRLTIFLPNIISHQIHTSVNKCDGMKCTFTHSYGTTALVWTIIQLVIWTSLIKRNSALFEDISDPSSAVTFQFDPYWCYLKEHNNMYTWMFL